MKTIVSLLKKYMKKRAVQRRQERIAFAETQANTILFKSVYPQPDGKVKEDRTTLSTQKVSQRKTRELWQMTHSI